ncbi:MAG: response regulator transcription factor [Treponemataceae bacterium]
MAKLIYCLEDEDSIRELICYTLKAANFNPKGFATPSEFWGALKEKRCDFILLDIMLPEEDGISVLKKLKSRNKYKDIPVLMTTAKGTEFDKVQALDLGADDYLVKPFGMMEMVSHIKAVLRRSEPSKKNSEIFQFEEIFVDKKKYFVQVRDEAINLTLKEFELLCLLVESPGIVFTREQLLEKVWGFDFMGETRTCDVHIGTLRTKLKTAGAYIKTVRGLGYKLEK